MPLEMDQKSKDRRIAEDLEMLRNTDRWPQQGGWLCVKKQPWFDREYDTGFGIIHESEPTKIHNHDRTAVLREYASLEEMAKEWSVD